MKNHTGVFEKQNKKTNNKPGLKNQMACEMK